MSTEKNKIFFNFFPPVYFRSTIYEDQLMNIFDILPNLKINVDLAVRYDQP